MPMHKTRISSLNGPEVQCTHLFSVANTTAIDWVSFNVKRFVWAHDSESPGLGTACGH